MKFERVYFTVKILFIFKKKNYYTLWYIYIYIYGVISFEILNDVTHIHLYDEFGWGENADDRKWRKEKGEERK